MRKMMAVIGLVLVGAGVLPAENAAPYPFQIKESVLATLSCGAHFKTYQNKNFKYEIWTQNKIFSDSSPTFKTEGRLNGKYLYKNIPFDTELKVSFENSVLETSAGAEQIELLFDRWLSKYQIPKAWRFKEPQLLRVNYVENQGFDALWKAKLNFDYLISARMAHPGWNQSVEDVSGALARYQDFALYMENDENLRALLKNNKSGLPITLNFEGDPEYPVFIAHYPLHKISWDEKKNNLQFEYSDSLADAQFFPEIKAALQDKRVDAFVGEDKSGIQVKGKGGARFGSELFIYKVENKKGLLIKLKGRKVIQTQEVNL